MTSRSGTAPTGSWIGDDSHVTGQPALACGSNSSSPTPARTASDDNCSMMDSRLAALIQAMNGHPCSSHRRGWAAASCDLPTRRIPLTAHTVTVAASSRAWCSDASPTSPYNASALICPPHDAGSTRELVGLGARG